MCKINEINNTNKIPTKKKPTQTKKICNYFLAFTLSLVMTISILRIPLSLESMEEIDAKKGIQKVHSEHPKQCKWQLNALSEFGSIPDELGGDE